MMRLLLIWFILLPASHAVNSNRIRSSDYSGKKERISVLKKYLRMRSEVTDAQFDIYDVNLGAESSIPGPTHRDFKIAVALEKAAAKKWLSDVVITSFPKDASWCRALIDGKENFNLRHKNDFWTYTGKDKVVFYYEKDGILCMRIYQE